MRRLRLFALGVASFAILTSVTLPASADPDGPGPPRASADYPQSDGGPSAHQPEAGGGPAPEGCTPVAIVAFRGSGEKNTSGDPKSLDGISTRYDGTKLVTNGWEGPTLRRMLKSFATSTNASWPKGFEPEEVPVLGIGWDGNAGYEAIPAEGTTSIFVDLIESASSGAMHAVDQIKEFRAAQPPGCNTRFIAVGYSQGAMAARYVQEASLSVVGVVNLGDPFQKPGGKGNEEVAGSAPHGEGIVRAALAGGGKEIIDSHYSTPGHKSALCHDRDPICSYDWVAGLLSLKFAIGPHLNYVTSTAEAKRKGQELADLAAANFKQTESTPLPSRAAMDVMVAIDTTGSMSPYIDDAAEHARQVADTVLSSADIGRVGLAEYRDHGDAFVSRTVVPLTSSSDQYEAGLRRLTADGGGDWPEALVSGVFEAARQDWNPSAAKSIIVIADAPGHDPEPVTGYTFAQMTNVLKGRSAVPVLPSVHGLTIGTEDTEDRNAGQLRLTEESSPPQEKSRTRVLPKSIDDQTALAAELEGSSISLYSLSADPELTTQLGPVSAETGGFSTDLSNAEEVSEKILEAVEDTSAAPEAVLSATSLNLTTSPTLLSAIDSTASPKVASYEWDLDGDGSFEKTGDQATQEVVRDTPGAYVASVRVSDDRGRTSTATASYEVVALEDVRIPEVDPSDDSTLLASVALSHNPASAKRPAILTVRDALTDGERVGARLVPAGAANPWDVLATTTFELSSAEGLEGVSAQIEVTDTIEPGEYELLVLTTEGRHATIPITVQLDAAAPPVMPRTDEDTHEPEKQKPSTAEETLGPGSVEKDGRDLASTGLDGPRNAMIIGVGAALTIAGTVLLSARHRSRRH